MEKLEFLISGKFWQGLFDSEFDRGYMAALLLILAVLAVLLVIRFGIYLLFRTRRCKAVVIADPQGDVTIARDALVSAIRNRFAVYPDLTVKELRLFRKRKNYMLRIHCAFDGNAGSGFYALVEEIRPAVLDMLRETFGINNLKKIRFVLEEFMAADGIPAVPESIPAEQDRNAADSGF